MASLNNKSLMILAGFIGAIGLVPIFIKGEYILNILFLLCLYTILSHSWNILGGYCGQINLGQAAFFGMGSLCCRAVWVAGWPFPIALLCGALSALILACLIGLPTLRLRAHYFSIGTLGVAMIASITVQNVLPGVDFLPADLMSGYNPVTRFYAAFVVVILTIAGVYGINHSKLGLAMLCVREDEEAAAATGINVVKFKVIAMALSTFITGLAGGLFAYYYVSYYYYVPFDLVWSFDPVLIVFIGGAGTIAGPIIGAVGYVILKEIFAINLGQINVLIFGVVFILIVLFLPGGLVGMATKGRQSSKKC
ncbi:MAG: branched-chain amino acid ABC transporter permease [Deltaproteobacteria bacterium]|nr:branched-chain amino acid ABC transporter permease [Deltaproteobacteria bacterium]